MLKKLFVSLLILSALTSEGIINLPGNIYSFYLYSDIGSGLCGEKGLPPEQIKEADEANAILESGCSVSVLVLLLNNISKYKSKAFFGDLDFQGKYCLSYAPINPAYILSLCKNKEIIIRESDMSPPIANI